MLGGFAVEVKPISSIVKRFYRGSILRPRSLLFKAGIRPQTAMVPFRTTAVIPLSPYLQIHSHHSFIPFIPSRNYVSIVSILLFIIIPPPSLHHKQKTTKHPRHFHYPFHPCQPVVNLSRSTLSLVQEPITKEAFTPKMRDFLCFL